MCDTGAGSRARHAENKEIITPYLNVIPRRKTKSVGNSLKSTKNSGGAPAPAEAWSDFKKDQFGNALIQESPIPKLPLFNLNKKVIKKSSNSQTKFKSAYLN